MARALALLFVMMAAGSCTDGEAPPILVQDLGAPLDGPSGDLSGVGAACTTACDCAPGLACRKLKCETAAVPVFCCGAASCTGTHLCQFPDGTVSQCDRTDGGGTPVDVDAGATPAECVMNLCSEGPAGNAFCKLVCGGNTATCGKTGGIEHCVP